MNVARALEVRGVAILDVCAARLEVAAVRAAGNFFVCVVAGQPHLDVVGLACGKAQVARAQRNNAVGQLEPLQQIFGFSGHALELGIDPAVQVLEEGAAAVLMDRAVEHVLSAARDGRGDDADPFAELKTWYPFYGEIGPSGSEMGTSARSLVRRLLEVSCALPHGMDDIHVVGAQADLSSLADAYRPCLEASPGAAECARTALAAIDAFEASEKTMADLGACMLACSAPRASKAFPKDQVLLLKAEAADSFINAMVAVGSTATGQLLELARRVEAEYRELKRAAGGLDNNDLQRMTHEA